MPSKIGRVLEQLYNPAKWPPSGLPYLSLLNSLFLPMSVISLCTLFLDHVDQHYTFHSLHNSRICFGTAYGRWIIPYLDLQLNVTVQLPKKKKRSKRAATCIKMHNKNVSCHHYYAYILSWNLDSRALNNRKMYLINLVYTNSDCQGFIYILSICTAHID